MRPQRGDDAGPIVMFGTKWPSMTSTWIQSAPASAMARTSSPSLAKSADRIEGAMTTEVMAQNLRFVGRFGVEDAAREHVGRVDGHEIVDPHRAVLLEIAIGVAQPRAVERVADRAGVGEQRLSAARGDIALERRRARRAEFIVLRRQHRLGDRHQFAVR